ncbi:HNH endonuclease signature motif containing protein [Luteimicrobium album]|nr:HNH endonuclease signature motif containing protein [Luteimicrobium album]
MTTTAGEQGEHSELTLRGGAGIVTDQGPREVEALGEAIDAIVSLETAIRKLTAFRTMMVDAARRRVPAAEVALLSPASPAAKGPELSERAELAERAFVADLATALLLPEPTTRALVEDARSLVHDLPATLDALADGSISYRHAQRMIEHTADLEPEATRAVEAAALARAGCVTPTGLARHLRRARERVQPERQAVRHQRAATDRHVRLEPAADGMSWLTAFLPAATGHAVMDRLDHATTALAGRDEKRTRDQLRADVLAALLLDDAGGTAAGAFARVAPAPTSTERTVDDRAAVAGVARSVVPRVHVTVPVLTLLGQGDEPADLDGYGPIDAGTARELAAGAPSFTRLLTHPHTGAVLDVGRESYAVPADLRRHLVVRDATCRFPGCGRPAAACDVDHLVAYTDGGATSADNLIHLCRHHHRLKHETAWRPASSRDPAAPPGSVTWTSPTGRTHTSTPATPAGRPSLDRTGVNPAGGANARPRAPGGRPDDDLGPPRSDGRRRSAR